MAVKKADNIFVKAKAYRKKHPRTSFQDAIQIVKGKRRVSGAAKPKAEVSGKAVGKKPKKRSVTKTERITTIGSRNKKRTSPVQRAVNISKKISDLECLLKATKGHEAKNRVKRLINAEHDKLDAINLKSA